MKTTLITLSTAALLGLAIFNSGLTFDAANLTAGLFTLGLVAWTVSQYARVSRPINIDRPIRFPTPARLASAPSRTMRLAA